MADKRLIELALKGLEAEKERIDREIAELRSRSRPRKSAAPAPKRRRRRFTAAQRKASADRMKAWWAKRKKQGK